MALTRPSHGSVLGGVCAGVARHLGWDVTLLRVLTVVGAFFVGATVVVYIALWLLMPNDTL